MDINQNGIGSKDVLDANIATFSKMRAFDPPKVSTLSAVLDNIQGGKWRAPIEQLRGILAGGDEELYNKRKAFLPSFFISGTARDRKAMIEHSGFVQMDLDDLDDDLEEIRQTLIRDPHVGAVFTSPSGQGLKVAVRVGAIANDEEHEQAWTAVSEYVERIACRQPDPSCRNWSRHCLVSYDPDLFRNRRAQAFDWKGSKATEEEKREGDLSTKTTSTTRTTGTTSTTGTTPHVPPALHALALRKKFETDHEHLARLYNSLVERAFPPARSKRNETLVRAVTMLHRTVSKPVVLNFMEKFYLFIHSYFTDPLEEHMKQATAHLAAIDDNYPAALSDVERQYFELYDERRQAAFRILRDLAQYEGHGAPAAPLFAISQDHLALRIGEERGETARRILADFIRDQVIKVEVPGERRSAGNPGKTTIYRWLLL